MDSPSSLHLFAGGLGRESVLDGVPRGCVPGTRLWSTGSFAAVAESMEENDFGRAGQDFIKAWRD